MHGAPPDENSGDDETVHEDDEEEGSSGGSNDDGDDQEGSGMMESLSFSSGVNPSDNSVIPDCKVSRKTFNVSCSGETTTPKNLRNSRAFVNEQIRRLRAQLFELKVVK